MVTPSRLTDFPIYDLAEEVSGPFLELYICVPYSSGPRLGDVARTQLAKSWLSKSVGFIGGWLDAMDNIEDPALRQALEDVENKKGYWIHEIGELEDGFRIECGSETFRMKPSAADGAENVLAGGVIYYLTASAIRQAYTVFSAAGFVGPFPALLRLRNATGYRFSFRYSDPAVARAVFGTDMIESRFELNENPDSEGGDFALNAVAHFIGEAESKLTEPGIV